MPLYEYKCLKCGRTTEKIESVAGPHLKKCPHCGGKVEALLSAPAIQFKGAGWYVTDYARKSAGADSEKPAAESKETPGKETEAASKETAPRESPKESKEKKPARKK